MNKVMKNEKTLFSINDFFENLKISIVELRNLIRDNQEHHRANKEIRSEFEFLMENQSNDMFFPHKQYPNLSSWFIKNNFQKYVKEKFHLLKDFDEKTEKLKMMEKQLKKESKDKQIDLIEQINALKISRDIEKVKFNELIKERNELNKALKVFLKKENISWIE